MKNKELYQIIVGNLQQDLSTKIRSHKENSPFWTIDENMSEDEVLKQARQNFAALLSKELTELIKTI